MEVIFAVSEHILIAELLGELDHHAAEYVREDIDDAMRENSASCLVLDFSKVRYMDSSGIGLIIGRYKLMARRGGSVAVICPDGKIDRIFQMAGLYQIIERLA